MALIATALLLVAWASHGCLCWNHSQAPAWRPIHGAGPHYLTYSAYADRVDNRSSVRVIGIVPLHNVTTLHCHYQLRRRHWTSTVAHVVGMKEGRNLDGPTMSGAFLTCDVQPHSSPDSVVVTAHPSLDGLHPRHLDSLRVPVTPAGDPNVDRHFLGACVRLFGDSEYNTVTPRTVIQFIEHHRHIGFTHFTFYESALPPAVACVLEWYARAGVVTLLRFEHGIDPASIHMNGQVIAINDCVHRTRGRYDLFLQADVDEFVVPRGNASLSAIIATASKSGSSRPSEFGLRSSFFFVTKNETDALSTVRREDRILPYKYRSKYVAVPDEVVEAGIHYLYECRKPDEPYVVDPDTVLLHHYRRVDAPDGVIVNDIESIVGYQIVESSVRDDSMLAFVDAVRDRVLQAERHAQTCEGSTFTR